MNTLELVSYLRTNLLDDTGGQGVDWTDYSEDTFDSIQLRWTNEELVSNINEAITMVYRRIEPIRDTISISISQDITVYKLPSYVLKVIAAKREDGQHLDEISLADLWAYSSSGSRTGPLKRWTSDVDTNTLQVYPTPQKDEELSLHIYRLPKVRLDWTDLDKSPELNAYMHLPMMFYAAHLSYLKDEANALDPKKSREYLEMFDREFPFTSVYSNIRKSRTANKSIRYGGL